MDAGAIVGVLATVLEAIAFLLIARALVSWFPDLRRHQIVQLLFDITDPIIEPLRKVIPPIGMLDLSTMIAVFGLFMLAEVLRASV
ncbi:MAG: YggT family protein [Chloroflexi bacterium]|nr:YggT family protein [Chloroflexota bacterium]MDA1298314.1 YggT family protein [Chloroflexota bacterium]